MNIAWFLQLHKEIIYMSKRGTNDQQHIIDAIDRGDYDYVWEKVKWIGYKKLDFNERYSVFWSIIEKFDTEKNNNFIQYFSERIGYAANKSSESTVTSSRGVISKCKTETISPTECKGYPIAADLKKWH